jgi:hypothetical protein
MHLIMLSAPKMFFFLGLDMAQRVDYQPSNHDAMSSTPTTAKNKNKKQPYFVWN